MPEAVPAPPNLRQPSLLKDLIILTKPWIISLLLVTTVAPMFITPAGLPTWSQIGWILLAGYLMAGGANTLNMWFDRDIDQRMVRTRKRPIASGRIPAVAGLLYGLGLGAAAFAIFWIKFNPLTAWLGLAGYLFYVVIYTFWLKRSTPQNIVIGGAAGAFPPLVGWAAMTNSIDLGALYLFAIVFFWTPPHFWALALNKQRDYGNAGVPMMPNVRGVSETKRLMLLYTWMLLPITIMPAIIGLQGAFYAVAAVALGWRFLKYARTIVREDGVTATSWRLYKYSLSYLALLFTAMAIDAVLPWGHRANAPMEIVIFAPGNHTALNPDPGAR